MATLTQYVLTAKLQNFLESEGFQEFSESIALPYVNFAAKKTAAPGKQKKQKNCTKGRSCGYGCIDTKKDCRSPLEGQAKTYADWMAMQVGKAKTATPKKAASKAKSKKVAKLTQETKPVATALVKNPLLALPAAGQTSAPENKRNGAPLPIRDVKSAVLDAFGVKTSEALRKSNSFRMFSNGWMHRSTGESLDLKNPEHWKQLYRDRVGVLPDERFDAGKNAINGVDVTKYYRPWDVFGINPLDKKYDPPLKGLKGSQRKAAKDAAEKALIADIKKAYNALAQKYHPDKGGDPVVFSILTKMKNSLTATA